MLNEDVLCINRKIRPPTRANVNVFATLGKALVAHEARWPEAVTAIRLLALTGCRRSEVLYLRWGDIRKNAIVLPDSKTGPRSVPLGASARAIVDALPRPRRKEAFLFPKNAGRRSPYNIVACWHTVRADANLGRLRLHDLRHTAASHAVMSGENLPLVGKLLGHKRHETTAGYSQSCRRAPGRSRRECRRPRCSGHEIMSLS